MRTLLTLILAAGALGRALSAQTVAIQGVTVIDGTGAAPVPGRTVLIREGRIATIGGPELTPPPEAERIDGRGRWLLPGLIDMHAHVTLGPVHGIQTGAPTLEVDSAGIAWSLRTLLAFGVTTIRDPGASSAELAVAIRDSVAHGHLVGPRIFTAGEVIDQISFPGLVRPARDEAEMRAEVRRQASLGVDYVKLYATLPPALVRAGIEEAHRQGIKAVAHLFRTPWTAAATWGIDGLVHAPPGSPLLLTPEGGAAFRRNIAPSGRFMFQWFEYYEPASAQADSMIRAVVDHHVVHDPTLVVFEAVAWGDSARITRNPDLRYAPPALLRNWTSGEFVLSLGFRPAGYDSSRAVWPAVLRFVKQLYDRGVFLVAGTDANNPWVAPGPSLHRELELLVDAGIPPLQVLRIATANGAEALGIGGETGSVEPGKRADLLLLDADPVANIRNTRRIVWIMQGGRRWMPGQLLAPLGLPAPLR